MKILTNKELNGQHEITLASKLINDRHYRILIKLIVVTTIKGNEYLTHLEIIKKGSILLSTIYLSEAIERYNGIN